MAIAYSKNSVVGKIYRWYHGRFVDSNSCDVRRTILLAPLKLLLNPRVADREWPTWVAWFQVLAAWRTVVVWNAIKIKLGVIDAFLVATLAFEIFLVVAVACTLAAREAFLFVRGKHVRLPKISQPILIKNTREIVSDWWDDFYHKLCKPIVWK